MDSIGLIQCVVLIALLFVSAFFSSSETALTTVNLIRIRTLADEGNKKAETVLAVTDKRSKMLSTILIGNNITNISATSLMTVMVIRLFGDVYVGIGTGVLTLLVLLFGEITPKNLASAKAEEISLAFAGPISVLMTVFTPVIFLVDLLSKGITKLLRIDLTAGATITESELRTLVNVSEQEGVLESDESAMINNVIDLSDTLASEIMIPCIDMTEVPSDITYDGLIEVFRQHRFTRLPVYEDRTDNIIGIINIKDLLITDRDSFSVRSIMKEPHFTFGTKNISDLLDEMRSQSFSIVVVLDEYGSAEGIITLEDVLEEIVGDIRDEYAGRDVPEIVEIEKGREYSCLGSCDLEDVNEAVGTDLEPENYHTIGGYLIEHSEDNLPKPGEYVITPEGATLIVEAVRDNRILRVHIYLPDKEENEEGGAKE